MGRKHHDPWYDKSENRWFDGDGRPLKRCIDESDDEPEEDPRPWKRHQGPLPAPPVSVGSLNKRFTKHRDILALFTSGTQTKLLEALLANPTTAPVVKKNMETMYEDAVADFVASVHGKLKEATREMDSVKDIDEQAEIDMNDYIRAVQPLLEDVSVLARMPTACRTAAKGAWELLLAIALATDSGYHHTHNHPEERIPFDEAADALGLVLVQRRHKEEGKDFEFADDLEKLRDMRGEMAISWNAESWFPKTMKTLEDYAQKRSGTGTAEK